MVHIIIAKTVTLIYSFLYIVSHALSTWHLSYKIKKDIFLLKENIFFTHLVRYNKIFLSGMHVSCKKYGWLRFTAVYDSLSKDLLLNGLIVLLPICQQTLCRNIVPGHSLMLAKFE